MSGSDVVIDPRKDGARLSITLTFAGVAFCAFAIAVWNVAREVTTMTSRLAAVEVGLAATMKNADLTQFKSDMRDWTGKRVARLLGELKFQCPPYVVRGKPMFCEAATSRRADRDEE